MTIKDVLEKMDNFTDEERKNILAKMCELMSPVSKGSLMKFQSNWDSTKGFDAFKKEQNKIIKECIKLETAEFIGGTVRKHYKLAPIRLDTEI